MPHPRANRSIMGENVDNKAQPESLKLQTLEQVAGGQGKGQYSVASFSGSETQGDIEQEVRKGILFISSETATMSQDQEEFRSLVTSNK